MLAKRYYKRWNTKQKLRFQIVYGSVICKYVCLFAKVIDTEFFRGYTLFTKYWFPFRALAEYQFLTDMPKGTFATCKNKIQNLLKIGTGCLPVEKRDCLPWIFYFLMWFDIIAREVEVRGWKNFFWFRYSIISTGNFHRQITIYLVWFI